MNLFGSGRPSTILNNRAWEDRMIWKALLSELIGVALFQLLGSAVGFRPFETAAVYTALVYGSRYVSGGHLNPMVTLASTASGHLHWTRGIIYVAAQVAGAFLGAGLAPFLIPGVSFGDDNGTTCMRPARLLPSGLLGLSRKQLFVWELLLATFFVSVVYVTHIVKRTDTGPLAVGVALFAAMVTGGQFTGYSPLNPAISVASTVVFNCYWSWMWVYVLSQLAAVVTAGSWAVAFFGRGPHIAGDRPTELLGEALLASDRGPEDNAERAGLGESRPFVGSMS